MTTIVSANADAFIRTIHGSNVAGVYNTYTLDLYRYQLLYDSVIVQMNTYIRYFTKGDFDKLITKFTNKNYNSLILSADPLSFNTIDIENLTGFEYDPDKFNLMRESTYNVIDGLRQTVKVAQENIALQEDIVTLKVNYKDVLEDPVKLNDYINSNKINIIAFQASQPFNTTIELKPWYKEYFRLYGPPGNGVFQSELLAEIVMNLIYTNQIQEEDFINS
jgi:hypothetical protein|uniref:Uncharacterized protein n=1 Tax=viral metagenome TaxID=1070528 RepID=A0A6C0D2H8_9ZZZZ